MKISVFENPTVVKGLIIRGFFRKLRLLLVSLKIDFISVRILGCLRIFKNFRISFSKMLQYFSCAALTI